MKSRSELGLTTLEWLLIVAAVAGLAALAVVLVQNVVDETAEEISGSNARITAAQVAAEQINNSDDEDGEKQSACNRLNITYSDAFADRTSLWTDSDIVDDSTGGTCAVVTQAVAKAVADAATEAACETADNSPGQASSADRGGKTAEWIPDIDTATNNNQPDCVLN